jgi:putative holliday junction resolvase
MTDAGDETLQCAVPEYGALLGIDFGTKRIGVAICNDEQSMACPLENYTRRTRELDAKWLTELVAGYSIRGIVIGLPVHMSGDEGGKAREARAFGNWAAKLTSRPVAWWDERFSSAVADMYIEQAGLSQRKRKGRRDQLAAQVILQSFLDADDRSAGPLDLSRQPHTDE